MPYKAGHNNYCNYGGAPRDMTALSLSHRDERLRQLVGARDTQSAHVKRHQNTSIKTMSRQSLGCHRLLLLPLIRV